MNRSLRARHRWMTRSLAVGLPLLFLVAVFARQEAPQMPALPQAVDPSGTGQEQPGALRWESDAVLTHVPAGLRVYDAASSRFGGALEIAPLADPRRPDVLVYWSSRAEVEDRVPEDSHLLGRLAGVQPRRFLLPPAAANRGGSLYLYSLGHQELLDAAPLRGDTP